VVWKNSYFLRCVKGGRRAVAGDTNGHAGYKCSISHYIFSGVTPAIASSRLCEQAGARVRLGSLENLKIGYNPKIWLNYFWWFRKIVLFFYKSPFLHLGHYCNTLTVISYPLFCVSLCTKQCHATCYDCFKNYDIFRFFVRFSSASLAFFSEQH